MPFPLTAYEDSAALLAQLGTFWSETFAGSNEVLAILKARALLDRQAYDDLLAMVRAVSRLRIDPFHGVRWQPLTLLESQRNRTPVDLPHYDGTYTYSANTPISYGRFVANPQSSWPLPAGLVNVAMVTNRLSEPSLALVRGVDFTITKGVITFRDNPFANPLLPKSEIFIGNEVVDREATLWLYAADFDNDDIYKQFGYVLGISLPSGEAYKKVVNSVFDSLLEGTTARSVEEFFAACAGAPLAQGNEVVSTIYSDRRHKWVATTKWTYNIPLSATVTVAVGDTLVPGQTLCDAVRFYEFNRGQLPDGVTALHVAPELLRPGYFHGVSFENAKVPLEVDVNDPSGRTNARFEVVGLEADVEKFWADVREAGLSEFTLAELLDRRGAIVARADQPRALTLPEEVNPLSFLVANVLRNNAFLVRLRPSSFGSDALGLKAVKLLLRRVIPPATLCLLLTELALTEPSGMVEPAEVVTTTGSAAGSAAVNMAEFTVESVVAKQLSGRCE